MCGTHRSCASGFARPAASPASLAPAPAPSVTSLSSSGCPAEPSSNRSRLPARARPPVAAACAMRSSAVGIGLCVHTVSCFCLQRGRPVLCVLRTYVLGHPYGWYRHGDFGVAARLGLGLATNGECATAVRGVVTCAVSALPVRSPATRGVCAIALVVSCSGSASASAASASVRAHGSPLPGVISSSDRGRLRLSRVFASGASIRIAMCTPGHSGPSRGPWWFGLGTPVLSTFPINTLLHPAHLPMGCVVASWVWSGLVKSASA